MFVNIREKKILVAGAGRVAARRVRTLIGFADRITVIAPEADDAIRALADAGRITYLPRRAEAADAGGFDIVIAATSDRAANAEIGTYCRENGICVNVADDPEACDFLFPAVVCKGSLTAGITSGGEDHTAVRRARERIEEVL